MAFSISDVLAIIQNGVTAVNNLNIQMRGSLTAILSRFAGYESAWTAYTPTVTAGVGAYTTVSAAGRYKKNGKTVFLEVEVTITTNGAAAASTIITLPATAVSNAAFYGREAVVTGAALIGALQTATQFYILKYDNTYAGGDGRIFIISGTYEAA